MSVLYLATFCGLWQQLICVLLFSYCAINDDDVNLRGTAVFIGNFQNIPWLKSKEAFSETKFWLFWGGIVRSYLHIFGVDFIKKWNCRFSKLVNFVFYISDRSVYIYDAVLCKKGRSIKSDGHPTKIAHTCTVNLDLVCSAISFHSHYFYFKWIQWICFDLITFLLMKIPAFFTWES